MDDQEILTSVRNLMRLFDSYLDSDKVPRRIIKGYTDDYFLLLRIQLILDGHLHVSNEGLHSLTEQGQRSYG